MFPWGRVDAYTPAALSWRVPLWPSSFDDIDRTPIVQLTIILQSARRAAWPLMQSTIPRRHVMLHVSRPYWLWVILERKEESLVEVEWRCDHCDAPCRSLCFSALQKLVRVQVRTLKFDASGRLRSKVGTCITCVNNHTDYDFYLSFI